MVIFFFCTFVLIISGIRINVLDENLSVHNVLYGLRRWSWLRTKSWNTYALFCSNFVFFFNFGPQVHCNSLLKVKWIESVEINKENATREILGRSSNRPNFWSHNAAFDLLQTCYRQLNFWWPLISVTHVSRTCHGRHLSSRVTRHASEPHARSR